MPDRQVLNRNLLAPVLRQTALLAVAIAVCLQPAVHAQNSARRSSENSRAHISLPAGNWDSPISVEAEHAYRWREGEYEVIVLRGDCRVAQGTMAAVANEAVLWIDRNPQGPFAVKIIAYLDGGVDVTTAGPSGARFHDQTWLGRFFTRQDIRFAIQRPESMPDVLPKVYGRARTARAAERPAYRHVGFLQEEVAPDPGATTFSAGGRRVQIFPRSNTPIQLQTRPGATPDQQLYIVTQGVRAVVEGLEATEVGDLGKVILEADRVVVWGPSLGSLLQNRQAQTARDLPLEFYLEGNVIFRQGDRVIYAERMYYNATQTFGTILSAEVFTGVPGYDGILRLKADVLQQLNMQQFQAFGAAFTTSRLGGPRYWLQSNQVYFEDRQTPKQDLFSGTPLFDPQTGEAQIEHHLHAKSRNNFVYAGGLPIFYWPSLETDLTRPTFYVTRLGARKDNVFGSQFMIDWDLYQLFGFREPPVGTEWTLSTDYLSKRGPAAGTRFEYERNGIGLLPGSKRGFVDAWGIRDTGRDNLGADRRMLVPSQKDRGRLLWQHRQELPGGFRLQAELGWISDSNFLEQYFENEWDLNKDEATGFELKRLRENRELRLSGAFRLNDFFTVPEWLPRLDHYVTGHSLFGDHLTWYAHSQVGYGRLRTAEPPTDPTDAATFQPLAWEVPAKGVRAASRQELDFPMQLGWFKVVPYGLGEAAYWQEDINRNETARFYGQLGVRANLPIWSVDPAYQDTLWNLNGLAHKINLEADVYWLDSSRDLAQFPLYDALDDNSIEHFRRRFYFQTFGGLPGGTLPLRFDERYFALRSGLQRWVSAPSTEIADDLMVARVDLRQRWQTRRGAPGNERTVDWVVFNVGGALFPDPDRDNFGEVLGLMQYDFRWHLGDRFTILSDGFADMYDDGLRSVTLGGVLTRPNRGRLYLGYRSTEGPIQTSVVNASLSYRMSEKWIANLGSSVDFGPTGNIGQSVSLIRIGESMLVRLGFYVDRGRDNVGLQFSIEPRFLPSSRLDRLAGIKIPPVGSEGLE